MADGKITIDIIVDDKKVKTLTTELDKLEKATTKSGSGLNSLANSSKNTTDGIGKVSDSAKKATENTEKLEKNTKKVSDSLNDTQKSANDVTIGLDKAGNSSKKLADDVDKIAPASNKAKNSLKEQNKETDKVSATAPRASQSIKNFAISLGLVQVASKAFNIISNAMGEAIKRFDTLNKFPKMMQKLGYSANDVAESTDRLKNGIEGLPTKLDEVVSTAQQLTAITGDLKSSTKATLALNNAFLASGASGEDAARGLTQYTQMLSSGKVDLQSWKTLQETMPLALQKTAESFGFTGKSAQRDFYAALKSGKITFEDFQDRLIKLNEGVGGFAELAKENSKGIQTSFTNISSAITKGVANVITAFNELVKETTGQDIAANLDSLKGIINAIFKNIVGAIRGVIPFFKGLGGVISATIKILHEFSWAVKGLAAGVVAGVATMKVITYVTTWIGAVTRAIKVLTLAKHGSVAITYTLNNLTKLQLITVKAIALAQALYTGKISASTLAMTVFSGAVSLAKGALIALGGAFKSLTFIGLATLAVGAFVGGLVALFGWLNRETEETKKLKSEQEALVESTKQVTKSVKDSADERKKNLEKTTQTTQAYSKLIDEVEELANKEKRTAGETKMLNDKINTLNESIPNLNLAYDKNTKKLSHNNEEIKKRIELSNAQQTANQAQENLLKISEKQAEVERNLHELRRQKIKWEEAENVSASTKKEKIKELIEQENELVGVQKSLQAEYQETSRIQAEASEKAAQSTQEGHGQQVISYENLSESQKKAIDSMRSRYSELRDTTTNAFDVIDQKTAISADQMIANLEKNRKAMEQWSTNIAILAERGVDQGLLEQLRKMGPEGAAQAQVLVNSSDEKLQQLNETFRNAGASSVDGMKREMDSRKAGIEDTVKDMVTGIDNSFNNSIKAANFAELGKNVADGAAEGMQAGQENVKNAASNLGKVTEEEFRQRLGIHSPSRVFHENGQFIIDGLVQGIEQGQSKLKQVLTNLENVFKDTIRQIENETRNASNSLNNDMYNMGVHAMNGLASGINANMGAALYAAQNVANRITSTIRNALDIHSPSRVMKNKVGRFIPEGVAQGIDENTKYVEKSMFKLSDILTSVRPEKALGISNGLFSTKVANPQNYNTNSNVTTNYESLLNIEHFENTSNQDVRELFEQIKFLMREERLSF